MLRWRLILGTAFIAALVGLVYLDVRAAAESELPPGLFLLPLALTIAAAATREFVSFVQLRDPSFDGRLLQVGNWAIVASPWLGACVGGTDSVGRWQLLIFTLAVLAVFLGEIVRYDKDKSQRVTERLAASMLGLAYVGLLMSFVVRLRLLPAGIFPLVLMLVVVKMADTGAYAVGRLIGKRKLAPKLSPGKTWEGFFGGLLFSVLSGLATAYFFGVKLTGDHNLTTSLIALALVVGTVGVIGDLAESLLKRDYGRKDSSDWMPGFGGVLDLIDSPLFAAPVAWAFWEFGWILP